MYRLGIWNLCVTVTVYTTKRSLEAHADSSFIKYTYAYTILSAIFQINLGKLVAPLIHNLQSFL